MFSARQKIKSGEVREVGNQEVAGAAGDFLMLRNFGL
jgi:hypothetical protein